MNEKIYNHANVSRVATVSCRLCTSLEKPHGQRYAPAYTPAQAAKYSSEVQKRRG